MRILTKEEFEFWKIEFTKHIKEGAVFIHPTDTIYGLGCDATNEEAVKNLRHIKHRDEKPFSIIAPSFEWIYDNCVVSAAAREMLEKFPGPYTMIFQLKNKKAIAGSTNCGLPTIGIRIPNHWISQVVKELGFPVVTTSANISGKEYMTSLDDLDPKLHEEINFVLWDGEKAGRASTIINLAQETVQVMER